MTRDNRVTRGDRRRRGGAGAALAGARASSGEEMVSRAAVSRLRMYTSFCFSTAPIITARPRGSVATNWPGTIRRQPVLPYVSACTFSKQPFSAEYSTMTILPESDPTTT